MHASGDELRRFVRAVRRRWIALAMLEAAGLGALAATALGLVAMPVLMWRGTPGMGIAMALPVLGGIVGLAAGWLRRPGVLDAALEADRQLNTSDLLASGLLAARSAAEAPWQAAVAMSANQLAARLQPRHVMLRRLGGRAWGGIGLAAALLLTLGLMSANPRPGLAGAGAERSTQPTPPRRALDELEPDRAANGSRLADAQPGGARLHTAGGSAAAEEVVRDTSAAGDGETIGRGQAGTGGGEARSDEPGRADTPISAGDAQGSALGDGDPTGGSGRAASGAQPGAAPGGTVTADPDVRTAELPASPTWQTARQRAEQATRDGVVPDAYRDVVREYFSDRRDP